MLPILYETVMVRNMDELYRAIVDLSTTAGGKIIWYRGHAFHDWELLPSTHRHFNDSHENQLYVDFIKKATSRCSSCPTTSDGSGWLSLMQHYGLPTRLLDWSESPLIAAFFALTHTSPIGATQPSGDAAIWALLPGNLNNRHVSDHILPTEQELVKKIIGAAFRPDKYLDLPEELALAINIYQNDIRNMVQQSMFTIHHSRKPLEIFENSCGFLRRFIIPEDAKMNLATQLYHFGIRMSVVYPDLEHLAKEVYAIKIQLRDCIAKTRI